MRRVRATYRGFAKASRPTIKISLTKNLLQAAPSHIWTSAWR